MARSIASGMSAPTEAPHSAQGKLLDYACLSHPVSPSQTLSLVSMQQLKSAALSRLL